MNTTVVVLRLLHIGAGVFWAGAIMFFGLFLEPSIRAAGPGGGQVMQQLHLRKYSAVMPILALVAILTGFELLRRDFPGGPSAWISTRGGMTFVIGGSAALITLIMGVTVVLPTIKRVTELAARLGGMGSQPDPAVAQELVRLRGKMTLLARIATALVAVTVASMAVARYM